MIFLDTHALLWWALDRDKLSETARSTVEAMERKGGFASAISIWELGVKLQQGKIEMGISIDAFAQRIESSTSVELLPVDTRTWLNSLVLDWDHRDPADRVIVASALIQGVPLLTKDRAIHNFSGVRSLW